VPLDKRRKDLDLVFQIYIFLVLIDDVKLDRLNDHEFIKCRLKSKHPQYKLNQQYLFYLLNKCEYSSVS